MSMNNAFGFSLFLLILVALNIYFFYTLNTVKNQSTYSNVPGIKLDLATGVIKDIYHHLNYLPNHYKNKNPKFNFWKRNLINSFNFSKDIDTKNVWRNTELGASPASFFPNDKVGPGQILQSIRTSKIAVVDNAPKGTQLKLLFILEGKQKIYFKPKRYNVDEMIRGNVYAGFDRHNSEVFAYYLAMVLNLTWIPPSVIRRVHVTRDIVPVATTELKKTMVKHGSSSFCFYGKCFYCKRNETVCPDERGEIEGAAILYLDKPLRVYKSPWRRSYNSKKMEWETDNEFCKKVKESLSERRILDLIDVSIFDFLIQNGDRHHYEVYKDKILLLDNGKGLGNPNVDHLDILAPLYQCCMISSSTWQQLEMVSGGSLTDTIKQLAQMQGEQITTREHFNAVEMRLLKIYGAVQYCIARHGSAKVFKTLY